MIRLLAVVLLLSSAVYSEEQKANSYAFSELEKAVPELSGWRHVLSEESITTSSKDLKAKYEFDFSSSGSKNAKSLAHDDRSFLSFNGFAKQSTYMALDFTVNGSFVDEKPSQKLSGGISRIRDLAGSQIYRELLNLQAAAKKTYKFLSIRKKNNPKDYTWLNSPAVEQVRQLKLNQESSVAGIFALEDILLWSRNPSSRKVIAKHKVELEVPFLTKKTIKKTKSGCESRRVVFDQTKSEKIALAKTTLYRHVLVNQSLLSKARREIVYFLENGVPFLLLSYDEQDLPLKLVLNLIDLQGLPLESRVYSQKQHSRIQYKKFQFCSSYPSGVSLDDYDPAEL